MRIVWRHLRPNPRQIKDAGNGAHEMIVRHSVFEIERIEQLSLVPAAPPHHGPPHRFASASRNHRATDPSTSFATKSVMSDKAHSEQNESAPPAQSGHRADRCISCFGPWADLATKRQH